MVTKNIAFQFENIYKRLGSFKQWPDDLNMRPEELAEAGLYHSPSDDDADQVIIKNYIEISKR